MAFDQLYYTSCEHGLGGYSGYQFNAVTPGVSPAVMREVEDRTVYQPPGRLRANANPDAPDAYPVAFSYGTSEATGAVITAQVVFAGTDYSGRPGNYFAHALVTDTPERDFGSLLPAELWRAEFWQRQPVAGTTLPELPGPPPRGAVDRADIQTFLDSPGTPDILPQLLTAVGKAMAGDRPVLLASRDAGDSIWWIAAVSYLLGPHLARQLTFTTYSHRPAYTRYHLTGVLPESLPPDAAMSFQLFDLTTGQVPDGGVHPLAGILAGTSVMAAPGLWQQAAAFRPAPGPGFDGWLPPVAVAAGLLGRSLSDAETDEIARWLVTAADSLPEQLADAALGVTLAQPDGRLSSRRLRELLGLARRLAAPDRAGRLELMLAERALARLARGEPADPVELTGQAADEARTETLRLLGSAPLATSLTVLEWAAASGLSLPDAELEAYGRTRLDPRDGTPELAAVLGRSPAIRRGLLSRVAGEPPATAEALLGGPAGGAIGRDDLVAYPGLAELWLIHAAARGAIEPLRAFDEISDIRVLTRQSRRMDGELLRRLWPAGCPPEQLAALLGAVTVTPAATGGAGTPGTPGTPEAPGAPGPDVLHWLTAEIGAVVARGMLDSGSLQLATALAEHPVLPLLPEAQRRALRDAAHVEPLLREADEAVGRGDVTVFGGLFAAYAAVDGDGRRLLETQLPPLLARAEPLGRALRGCPERVAAGFCQDLWAWLSPLRADVRLARQVFGALAQPDVMRQPALADGLPAAFNRVLQWRRRDLGVLTRALEDDGLGESFRDWRDRQRDAHRDAQRAGRKRWPFGGDRRREEA